MAVGRVVGRPTRSIATMLLGLAVSAPVCAQVRSLTVIPIKFQDNPASPYDESTCEGTFTLGADGLPNGCSPIPISRYRTVLARNTTDRNATTMANWIYDATDGQTQLNVTVLPEYIRVPSVYPLGLAADGRAAACKNAGSSWSNYASAAARAAGYRWAGDALTEVPQSFGRCDHLDDSRTAIHSLGDAASSIFLQYIATVVGFDFPGTEWRCRGADGVTWVVISSDCFSQLHHHGLSLAGQGTGLLNLANRLANGTLPASQVETVPLTGPFPLTRTISPMEVVPPAGGIRGLRVPGLTPNGIDFEYHLATKWQGWATGGLTAHVMGQSRYLLDLTPDGKVIGDGATYMLMPGSSYVHPSGLRVRVISASNAGIVVTIDQTAPPAPMTCEVSPNGAPGQALTVQEDATCARYTVGGNNHIVRNNVDTGFNAGTHYVSCGGVGYRYLVEQDGHVWSWRLSSSPTAAPLPSGCVNTAPPPPPR